jgi:hypothetical protein
MTDALRARLFPTAPVEAPVEEAPLVTYVQSDPYAWMSDAERAYHTHGGVTR